MVKFRRLLLTFILLVFIAAIPLAAVQAQTYRFTLPEYEVEAYLEADGSLTLYYYMVFENDRSASPIDFIDLGLPDGSYQFNNIEATVDGKPITKIGNSAYVDGAELALGSDAIPAGQQGTVIVWVRQVKNVLFTYDGDDRENYINFQISPNFFGSEFERSTVTHYRMTIILPPGVGNQDGVYFEPGGWPGSTIPEASTTQDGRVYYSWYTENANVHTRYLFGAAFPASAVPAEAVVSGGTVSNGGSSGGSSGSGIFNFIRRAIGAMPCLGFFIVIGAGLLFGNKASSKAAKQRKLQYFPPKISVEGQGIKRGLTAVESAILMEQPIDKVMTMVLFGLLKKEAVTVESRDPLVITPSNPLPQGLHEYEMDFIKAFQAEGKTQRRRALQSMTIDLVKVVQDKMRGFSKKDTVLYYEDIMRRAWEAVEKAETPEVKSAQYEKNLEWTMLDKEFNDRTERTFSGGPVIIPRWWGRYDPVYRQGSGGGLASPVPSSTGGGMSSRSGAPAGGPSLNLPSIPGADFAASVITGTSNMAAGALGNVADFTSSVTNRTNPIPVSRPSSGGGGFRGGGGGGSSCACACACAGCACACAGGGR